jgi:hypothetical protein
MWIGVENAGARRVAKGAHHGGVAAPRRRCRRGWTGLERGRATLKTTHTDIERVCHTVNDPPPLHLPHLPSSISGRGAGAGNGNGVGVVRIGLAL